MNPKAAYLALNGFVLTNYIGSDMTTLPIKHTLRIKRQLADYERHIAWSSHWFPMQSGELGVYEVRPWDEFPDALWDSLLWRHIHKLVAES